MSRANQHIKTWIYHAVIWPKEFQRGRIGEGEAADKVERLGGGLKKKQASFGVLVRLRRFTSEGESDSHR
jgi:hypothetical protein